MKPAPYTFPHRSRAAMTDYGYADCLSDLQEAAQAFGECYVEAWRGWIHVR